MHAHQSHETSSPHAGLPPVTQPSLSHRLEYRIRLQPGSDQRAPGGAVTVALCGHWDHEGPCRWPHLSTMTEDQDGDHRLVVVFDAHVEELERVRTLIRAAVMHGQLTGPDGVLSLWEAESVTGGGEG